MADNNAVESLPSEEKPAVDLKARQWAMFCHITALTVFLALPFTNIIVPWLIWWFKRGLDPFVDHHGKESVNFQITMTLYWLLALLLCYVLIGMVILPVLLVLDIFLVVKATMRADKGLTVHYPATLRFLK